MGVFDDPKEVGRRIAAARGYFREGQKAFGKRIGKSDKTIGAIERGEVRSVAEIEMSVADVRAEFERQSTELSKRITEAIESDKPVERRGKSGNSSRRPNRQEAP